MKTVIASALALSIIVGPTLAQESGTKPVPVRFKPREACWEYAGKASSFSLHGNMGEQLSVQSNGIAMYTLDAGATDRLSIQDHQVALSLGTIAVQPNKGGVYSLPATGEYLITLWPHSMQGGDGLTVICKE